MIEKYFERPIQHKIEIQADTTSFNDVFKHNFCIMSYVPRELAPKKPSNRRLYVHGIWYISDTARQPPPPEQLGIRIGWSPNRGREAPEIWRRNPNWGRSPRKIGARGLGEPLPRKFLEFQTSNRSLWCIVEREILKKIEFSKKT